jgi:hypothetical protein
MKNAAKSNKDFFAVKKNQLKSRPLMGEALNPIFR